MASISAGVRSLTIPCITGALRTTCWMYSTWCATYVACWPASRGKMPRPARVRAVTGRARGNGAFRNAGLEQCLALGDQRRVAGTPRRRRLCGVVLGDALDQRRIEIACDAVHDVVRRLLFARMRLERLDLRNQIIRLLRGEIGKDRRNADAARAMTGRAEIDRLVFARRPLVPAGRPLRDCRADRPGQRKRQNRIC